MLNENWTDGNDGLQKWIYYSLKFVVATHHLTITTLLKVKIFTAVHIEFDHKDLIDLLGHLRDHELDVRQDYRDY